MESGNFYNISTWNDHREPRSIVKAHRRRTQFGNAVRFPGFQKTTNLLLEKFYWMFYIISTDGAIYFLMSIKSFYSMQLICYWKMKNRASLLACFGLYARLRFAEKWILPLNFVTRLLQFCWFIPYFNYWLYINAFRACLYERAGRVVCRDPGLHIFL